MRTKSERRHHRDRMKARVQKFLWLPKEPEARDRLVHRLADTRKRCSCDSCGNPRRHHQELTVQERRWAVWSKEEAE
jgi:hypothetical protein